MPGRALIVTALRLQNLPENVHGVFQRLRLFVEAAHRACARVDILCLRPLPGRAAGLDPETAADVARAWGLECRVINGHWEDPPLASPYVLEQLRWIAGYRLSRAFAGLDNRVNRAALDERLADTPRFVIAHKLPVMELIRTRRKSAPVLFDLDDIEHVAFERHAAQIQQRRERWVARAMVPAIRRAVTHAVHTADRTFVCSAHDAELLERTLSLPRTRSVLVPNAAAIRDTAPVPSEPVLLFVGTFGWTPNVEAMDFFLSQCWPQIRAQVPGARLRIVGRSPEKIAQFPRAPAGVEFAGFVPDIDAEYRRARVVICPIVSGGGTRVKLVEAAAFGTAIVSTRVGAEGLDFQDDVHALLRDPPEEFAAACVRLLRDQEACARLAAQVHEHAKAHFDRSSVLRAIGAAIGECLGERSSAAHAAGGRLGLK